MKTKHILSWSAVLLFGLSAATGRAATMTVTANAPDVIATDGTCSLREAISAANGNSLNADCPNSGAAFGNDIINLPAGTYTTALATGCENGNASGDYDIVVVGVAESLTINGAGASTTIIDGAGIDRLFDLIQQTSSPTVTLNDVTIRNGTARTQPVSTCIAGGNGGAIQIGFGSTLNLNRSIVETSVADEGGGIYNNNILNIDESAIQNNDANFAGGGLCNTVSVTATITNSTISGNDAGASGGNEGNGGGLANDTSAQLTLINSTVSGNRAFGSDVSGNGGGISVVSFGTVRLRNVTVTNNTADADGLDFGDGGGIWLQSPGTASPDALILRNTIIAGNNDGSSGTSPDCFQAPSTPAPITSEGFNLIGDDTGCDGEFAATGDQAGTDVSPIDPLLDPLANYGGPTETHQLQLTSPAVDLGNNVQGCTSDDGQTTVLARDQRDFPRPVDGNGDATIRCDIGAFELQAADLCGNNVLDPTEECDDGNTADGDGCSALCEIEPSCGDGNVDAGEQCDDGNSVDGDGCSTNCTTEIVADCGDGNLDSGEQCDDGNLSNGDGCSDLCLIETGSSCNTRDANIPSVCEPGCGDGSLGSTEECDDGNNVDGDGCSGVCTLEEGLEACGDGNVDAGEECDDGNNVNGDGCSTVCDIEIGFTCSGSPSACVGGCGDGDPERPEECDDGNNVDGDGCSSSCEIEAANYCSLNPTNCVVFLVGDGGCSLIAAASSEGIIPILGLLTMPAVLLMRRRRSE
jgi:cysteine-rich repeat protein